MYQYKFDLERCWWKDKCDKQNTDQCGASCIRYMEVDYLLYASGLPKARHKTERLIPQKVDVESFRYLGRVLGNVESFVAQGHNLYIYSVKFGNGKTSWAIKILQKYFSRIWAGNGFRPRGVFMHVPTFLNTLKSTISCPDIEFNRIRSLLPHADVVVWDDIAATKLSDYDHGQLLSYIDQRVLNGLSNIYTGNLDGTNIANAIGNRLASRVWNLSEKVRLEGEDSRGVAW